MTRTATARPAVIASIKPKRLSDYQYASSPIRATYDAAALTDENNAHWAAADALSPVAALSPVVRARARNRARYEVGSNGFAKGVVNTLANYIVGTGPRLQLLTDDPELNKRAEAAWKRWAKRVRLARKLRTVVKAWAVDGEGFIRIVNNPPLRHPVKLDIRTLECDRVTDPILRTQLRHADGLMHDDWGNIVAYLVAREHPGGAVYTTMINDPETVPADTMIHLFTADRAEQERGLSLFAPTLTLFAQSRRFRLATLAAAETAADLAGIIKTQQSPENPDELEPLDAIDIRRRMLMTMPMGWDISQLKAEHPTTTYDQFVNANLAESARPMNMPRNIAAANSSGYNFASAKLDMMVFGKAVGVDRDEVEETALDPIGDKWWAEASRISGLLDTDKSDEMPAHEWYWDGDETLDPREAGAGATKLANGMMSFADYYGRRGMDWEEQQESQAKALGMKLPEYRKRLADKLLGTPNQAAPNAVTNTTNDEDDDDEDE